MADTLSSLIIMFFVFSVLGWITEVVLKYFEFRRFINRGFLIGPYCPVYGFGVVAVTVVVGGLAMRKGTLCEIFLAGMILCGVLEYFTGWYMEKLYHARWWDYSQMPMNLHGRIWIGNLILFGLACVVIVKFIAPVFFGLTAKITPSAMHITAVCIIIIMSADYVISHLLMNKIKTAIENQKGDNTEEISLRIHAMLADKSIWLRRIHNAFINMQVRPRSVMAEYKKAVAEYRQIRRRGKQLRRFADDAVRKGISRVEADRIRSEAVAAMNDARIKLHKLRERFGISDHLSDK